MEARVASALPDAAVGGGTEVEGKEGKVPLMDCADGACFVLFPVDLRAVAIVAMLFGCCVESCGATAGTDELLAVDMDHLFNNSWSEGISGCVRRCRSPRILGEREYSSSFPGMTLNFGVGGTNIVGVRFADAEVLAAAEGVSETGTFLDAEGRPGL